MYFSIHICYQVVVVEEKKKYSKSLDPQSNFLGGRPSAGADRGTSMSLGDGAMVKYLISLWRVTHGMREPSAHGTLTHLRSVDCKRFPCKKTKQKCL